MGVGCGVLVGIGVLVGVGVPTGERCSMEQAPFTSRISDMVIERAPASRAFLQEIILTSPVGNLPSIHYIHRKAALFLVDANCSTGCESLDKGEGYPSPIVSSFSVSKRSTTWGLAFPRVAFIT